MQEVPEDLMQLAMQSSWFRKSRFKKGKGKNLNIGGCGLGYVHVEYSKQLPYRIYIIAGYI